ncbi:MAG: hypothetical protein HY817_02155 [Candidatus Abawacabacteria bacterium]|nr:hypothetical protein [Candidatus Abawacabacteria bacterium]
MTQQPKEAIECYPLIESLLPPDMQRQIGELPICLQEVIEQILEEQRKPMPVAPTGLDLGICYMVRLALPKLECICGLKIEIVINAKDALTLVITPQEAQIEIEALLPGIDESYIGIVRATMYDIYEDEKNAWQTASQMNIAQLQVAARNQHVLSREIPHFVISHPQLTSMQTYCDIVHTNSLRHYFTVFQRRIRKSIARAYRRWKS